MALRSRRALNLGAAALALLCTAGLLYEGRELLALESYNAALARGAFAEAGRERSPHGAFAEAYALQRAERFDDALQRYAAIDAGAAPALGVALEYNLANLHFQHALLAYRDGQPDLAIPLIELAKQSYRDLLSRHSDLWEARYNLELALRLLPDPEELDPLEENMPERSQRALGAVKSYQQLP